MPRQARAWIGTSGWNYSSWRGVLYPRGLTQGNWLSHYTREFDTVELNNSFYRIPSTDAVRDWGENAPKRFRFAVKLWRGITHLKKLKDCDEYLSNFLSVINGLDKRQRAPLLVQLPPNLKREIDRLDFFLGSLKELVGRHWKVAVEFRNDEWLCRDVYQLLDSNHVALCLHDNAGQSGRQRT